MREFFVQYSSSGHGMALVWGAAPQTRSDRRKDRVETNPEQLAAASAQAEISFNIYLMIIPIYTLCSICFLLRKYSFLDGETHNIS